MLIDNDNFSRFHIADKLGVDEVKTQVSLAQNPCVSYFPDGQEPESVGITDTNQPPSVMITTVGAFYLSCCLDQIIVTPAEVGWAMRCKIISLSTMV